MLFTQILKKHSVEWIINYLLKLEAYRFRHPFSSLFENVLTYRTQFVKYENLISDNIAVVSGMP